LQASLAHLASVIVDRAESEIEVLMPAYTHLQRAQPSRLSHHLLAWEEILFRDWGRLADALERMNESPLGAGAVAGTGFTLDREGVARELGFERPMRNSIDATGSRDFLMEIAGAIAILGVHLSRIGEEVVLWSSQEFGFMTLADGFATSSSMLPQKKTPDVAELVRGRAARLVGSVTSLYVLEKGLPFGYARDLQEDKRPIFDAFACAGISLDALSGALASAKFHAVAMRAALDRGHLCATDLADLLVQREVPFRQAHRVIGGLVREAEQRGIELSALPKEVLEAAHPALGTADARAALDPVQAVERRVAGGPARESVKKAILDARSRWHAVVPAKA
jgi:argininosuccinate lyase